MSSPITAADFPIIAQSGSVCDQLLALIQTNSKLKTFFEWMLDENGNLSDEFKASLSEAILPPGCVVWRPVSSVPEGFLICNGQTVSRETYAALFAAIGTVFGAGDGSTTFKLPDLQERYLSGAGGTHSVGQDFGEATHALTVAELPSHSHNIVNKVSAIDDVGAGQRAFNDGNRPQQVADITTATEVAGGSLGHNNLPPTMAGLWLIRT